jgi:hypothetical protein
MALDQKKSEKPMKLTTLFAAIALLWASQSYAYTSRPFTMGGNTYYAQIKGSRAHKIYIAEGFAEILAAEWCADNNGTQNGARRVSKFRVERLQWGAYWAEAEFQCL